MYSGESDSKGAKIMSCISKEQDDILYTVSTVEDSGVTKMTSWKKWPLRKQ